MVIEQLEQVCKVKRTWNLAPVLQIVQKIPENYCIWSYLSIGQVWWLNELCFKRYIQNCMHPFSCTNTHHDDIDFANSRMVKNTKTWISWELNITSLGNKILNCASDFYWTLFFLNSDICYRPITLEENGQLNQKVFLNLCKCSILFWAVSEKYL